MIALQFSPIQTYVTQKVASYLSDELDSKITLKRIYFKPFNALELEELNIQDLQGDTILHAGNFIADLDLKDFFNDKITIKKINLYNSSLNIQVFADSSNIDKYIAYFKSEKKGNNNQKKLIVNLNQIELINNRFKLINHKYKYPRKGVNFANLDLNNISGKIEDIELDSIISAKIKDIKFQEKSGFQLKELTTAVTYATTSLRFDDLFIKTNRSTISNKIHFEYDKIQDFGDFINSVTVKASLKNSIVDSKDIEFFAPSLNHVIFNTRITTAELSGKVKNIIAKNVKIETSNKTELNGNFKIVGLPNIDKTIFSFDLKHLKTNVEDVESLVQQLGNKSKFQLPTQLQKFGNIDYEGTFVGLYNNFQLQGNFHTALGKVNTNSKIDFSKGMNYSGRASSSSFEINKIIATDIIGTTGFDLTYSGNELNVEKLRLNVTGLLKQANIYQYSYDKIALDAQFQDKQLAIKGSVNDKNLHLDYQTHIDWSSNQPNYLLDATIHHAAPNKLKWTNKDSIIVHHAIINTNLFGNSLNTLNGYLNADSLHFSTTKGDFIINSFSLQAQTVADNRLLKVKSDVLDAKLSGIIDLNTVIPYFQSLAMRYAPAINIENKPYNRQDFDLELNIKSFQPIAAFVDQRLLLDDGAHLSAKFSSENFLASFLAYSPTVIYKGIKLNNVAIEENANQQSLSLNIYADKLNFGDSTYIKNISISNVLANDSLNFNIELSEKTAKNYLDLNGNVHFAPNAPAYIKFNPSSIFINNENWEINKDALLRVSKGKIYISNLKLSQNQQLVQFDGIISNLIEEKLNISFNKFNLTSFNGLTNPLGIHLKGMMNGTVAIASVLNNPFASSNITTSPIIYNNIPIGTLALNANFDPQYGAMNIDLKLHDELNRGISANGSYNFYDENEPLVLTGKLNETDLTIFQPFLKNLVSNLHGKANADVEIKGTLKNPKITGIGRFFDSKFTVNYLKTEYTVDKQMAMVENNAILLNNFQIKDSKGSTATANGLINLAKLAIPYIDVDVQGNNFMILNTTYKDNSLYYGTANATGKFKFKGYTSAIDIDINAQSENGTVINIPFNSAMTISESDFIYFVSKDSTENLNREKKSLFKGITMDMDLSLSRNAEVNLQTSLGSLRGNGNGLINMKISSLGDFEMFGDYSINNGKFHFTAQDFINKYFDIKEGGTIRWTGKPSDATINLNAIYQQRTAISALYNAAGHTGDNERVLAQADMLIKGTLDQPDISFDLNFPQNPYIKDQLQSYLSDANNVNQQALSLIVRRSFTPGSSSEIGKEVNNTLLSAGTEIAFNQLNNIISQSLNINFFDLNIRSFNDASASVRLWNDRLILTGGITDRTNYQANDLTFFREGFATDAELTYRLRKDGNLLFRAYNRPYTRNFLIRSTDAEYISALGLVYRQEFNSMQEFWKKLWNWRGSKDNKSLLLKK